MTCDQTKSIVQCRCQATAAGCYEVQGSTQMFSLLYTQLSEAESDSLSTTLSAGCTVSGPSPQTVLISEILARA